MKVLVVGSGGREHALCWTLAASPLADALYCAPGNAGIAQEATCVDIKADDVSGLRDFAVKEGIDLVVIGPEAPLVGGLVDELSAAGIKAFGPTKAAAELEGSKGFMKDLCARHGIPTAAYRRFDEADAEAAKAYARELGAPLVVKADGLAAGKGVTVCQTLEEADEAIDAMLRDHRFGEASAEIVVEECLIGEEASAFALVDGETALLLPSCQDHKRAYDGDTGPNTGGMGAYSPAPVMTAELEEQVRREILQPTVDAMKAEGRPFKGVLYAGLMITEDGPKLLEFNARFGDPECQVLMMRLMSDLLPALVACCDGVLKSFDLRWYVESAICVVMAARGYPGDYMKGEPIGRLDKAGADNDVMIFHAGTKLGDQGRVVSNGGRVLGITALGNSLAEAHDRVYAAIDEIDWPGGFCRRDIGWRALSSGTIPSED
ncbi:phosphoribosylamine--glycine ligase [Ferruginivarius sediminum]|uniref:Phosphoribosylamine--glycine ligase n=1 Tax=Ferruginivarius sediminum TaxID=2661937 RepID=A0A369TAK3_9PROT|nr:phosphoribosylamine--glycine ligase [Ferruginivarius sediminum]RDD62361.1 phosphoribosylamine--glycine ligase [Ferruginivarius sediminum]